MLRQLAHAHRRARLEHRATHTDPNHRAARHRGRTRPPRRGHPHRRRLHRRPRPLPRHGTERDGSLWLSVSHFEDGATSYLYQRFDLDGRVIEERTGREARPDRAPVNRPTCNVPPAALAVAIPDAPFGIRASATSPDCSKVVLVANIEDPNIVGGRQALWLLDVPTASLTLLTDQARSCGGCDLAASGGRSPSGRYVL